MGNNQKEEGSYGLQDENGEIVEKFRIKATAFAMKPIIEKQVFKKLKIVKLK